jgi:hypothetical protein
MHGNDIWILGDMKMCGTRVDQHAGVRLANWGDVLLSGVA